MMNSLFELDYSSSINNTIIIVYKYAKSKRKNLVGFIQRKNVVQLPSTSAILKISIERGFLRNNDSLLEGTALGLLSLYNIAQCTCSTPIPPQRTKPIHPDISQLLRSPHAINSSHTSETSQFLLDAEAEVRGLDVQTSRLQSMITAIRTKREIVKMEMAKYKSLLAPVRRMPNEILNHIFVLYAHLQRNEFTSYGWSFPGLSVALVCRRWRDVALTCPDLWSSITISLDEDSSHFKDITDATEICLAENASLEHYVDVIALLQKVVQHSRRWTRVDFCSDDVPYVRQTLSNANFANLEILELGTFADPVLMIPLIFGALPKLQELKLEVPFFEVPMSLPWAQIRTLHFGPRYEAEISGVLDLCTSLQQLCYDTKPEPAHHPISHRSTTIQSFMLNATSWTSTGYQDVQLTLSGLDLPSLTTLCLKSRRQFIDDKEWPNDALTSFITRSACSITNLTLVNIPLDSSELISILELTPALTNLTVQQTLSGKKPTKLPLNMDFIHALHSYSRSSFRMQPLPLIPKLASLTLHVSSKWFDEEIFVDVVESRWVLDHVLLSGVGIDCLRSLELYVIDKAMDDNAYESLRVLQKDGLRLELRGRK
ncbi:hypothetical protein BT96DRAFT_1071364 [Gymnopus androsaceus JB14]|uniref:F-box domain-containing protein n=1 Tax=Gymnopus androsaceus JB14 TaxID=1447944 RepID=A0A6A4I1M0_9AGAR|nr:hypothetical protein BT96DRAFT_1071364 [Gymnopus androsaceus JB14]